MPPERRPPRDRGWKARGQLLDGPLAGHWIGRRTKEGDELTLHVQVDGAWREAVYLNVGPVPDVPAADGVGYRFVRYADEASDPPAKVLGDSDRERI